MADVTVTLDDEEQRIIESRAETRPTEYFWTGLARKIDDARKVQADVAAHWSTMGRREFCQDCQRSKTEIERHGHERWCVFARAARALPDPALVGEASASVAHTRLETVTCACDGSITDPRATHHPVNCSAAGNLTDHLGRQRPGQRIDDL